MVGKVGDDMYGPAVLDNLARVGVGTAAMETTEGPSGLAPIFLAETGENAIVVVPGANAKVDPAFVDRHADLIRSAGMVLCQLEIPMETISHTLNLCDKAGVPVMLDPAPAATLPEELWSKLAWFTPNETEAAFYLEKDQASESAAKLLLSRGLKGVVLKRGVEGSFVAVADGAAAWVSPLKVNAIDTVGAGDCFNGAIAVTRRGAQASMPTRAEIQEFLVKRK